MFSSPLFFHSLYHSSFGFQLYIVMTSRSLFFKKALSPTGSFSSPRLASLQARAVLLLSYTKKPFILRSFAAPPLSPATTFPDLESIDCHHSSDYVTNLPPPEHVSQIERAAFALLDDATLPVFGSIQPRSSPLTILNKPVSSP